MRSRDKGKSFFENGLFLADTLRSLRIVTASLSSIGDCRRALMVEASLILIVYVNKENHSTHCCSCEETDELCGTNYQNIMLYVPPVVFSLTGRRY